MKRCPKDEIVGTDEHCNGCIFDRKDKFGYYCDSIIGFLACGKAENGRIYFDGVNFINWNS